MAIIDGPDASKAEIVEAHKKAFRTILQSAKNEVDRVELYVESARIAAAESRVRLSIHTDELRQVREFYAGLRAIARELGIDVPTDE